MFKSNISYTTGSLRNILAVVFTIVFCMSFSAVAAQEQEQEQKKEQEQEQEQKKEKKQAPPHWAVPFEFDGDYGAPNGNALMTRFLPVWRVPINENWNMVNLDIITFADAPPLPGSPINPEPIPGEKASGLSDLVHVSMFIPKPTGKFFWGMGALVSLPTATDDALGSGKWTAGPAVLLGYKGDTWNIGGGFGQRWSFAGDSDRGDVSSLMVRASFRRSLGGDWFFLSAPRINVNWNSKSGEKLLLPLGGGIGRTFPVGSQTWSANVQAFANVIKPTGAPDWSLRVAFIARVPKDWFMPGS